MDINKLYFIQLPLRPKEYNYEFSVEVGSTSYILWIYFNRRMERWILNVKDENNDPIVMSIPILVGAQMLSRFADSRINDLKLIFAYNLKNENEEIGEFDLGNTASLFITREVEE